MPDRDQYDTEGVLAQAEAAARRSEDDLAVVLAEVDRAQASIARGRAELAQARAELEREADEEERRARAGELGRARRVVQERIDRDETTWRAVMSDVDQHWSAVEVRGETVAAWRTAIDRLEQEDPEFAALYRSVAEGRDPAERPGEWDSLGPASDAEPPVRPGETWPRSGPHRPGPDVPDPGRW